MPDGQVESRKPNLVHSWNVRGCSQAIFCRNGVRSDRTATYLRQGISGLVNHEVDLTGHQILHGWSDTAIGHELIASPRFHLEIEAGYVLWTAGAGSPLCCFVRIFP